MFNDFQIREKMLNDFGFGTPDQIEASRELLYPFMWVNLLDTQYVENGKCESYHFEILFADKVMSGEDNYLELLSNTQYIYRQFISELALHPYWDDMGLTIVKSRIITTPGYLILDGNLQGFKIDFSIMEPIRIDPTNSPVIPITDYITVFENQTNEYRLIGTQGPQGPSGPQGFQGPAGSGGTGSYSGATIERISGSFSGLLMSGSPTLFYDISFGTASFVNDYCVSIESDTPRNWTIDNKTANGFRVHSNSGVTVFDTVYWEADELVSGSFGLISGGGSGAVPNLNQVLNTGNTSSNNINLVGNGAGLNIGSSNVTWYSTAIGFTLSVGIASATAGVFVPLFQAKSGTIALLSDITGASGSGATGPQGPQGAAGTNGSQGPQGFQGANGTIGLQGPQGTQGNTGNTGLQGPQGTQGNNGTNGLIGATGSQGPQGTQGNTGNTGLQGPQGTQGNNGANGLLGATGPQGVQGVQGPAGGGTGSGAQGPQGTQGNTGIAGATGPQGFQGNNGTTGLQGPQGTQGNTGNTGATGPTGPQGLQGANGTIGLQGPQGTQGNTGTTGLQGGTGSTGPQGFQGTQGNTGTTGLQGPTGPQGVTGARGATGPQGFQGTQGFQGFQGPAGSGGTGSGSSQNLDQVLNIGNTSSQFIQLLNNISGLPSIEMGNNNILTIADDGTTQAGFYTSADGSQNVIYGVNSLAGEVDIQFPTQSTVTNTQYIQPRDGTIALMPTVQFTGVHTYSVILDDSNKKILMTFSGGCLVTVPSYSAGDIPIGTEWNFVSYGAQPVQFTFSSPVVVNSNGGRYKINGQYVAVSLTNINTNQWLLIGNLA